MANPLTASLLSYGALTADLNGEAVDISTLRKVGKFSIQGFAVSTAAGAPAIKLQTSPNGTDWINLHSQSFSVPKTEMMLLAGLHRYVRIVVTVPAGSSITLMASVEAHQVYCDPEDVRRYGVTAGALEDVEEATIVDFCLSVTDIADGYLGAAFMLPILAFGEDLRLHCSKILIRYLFDRRGWDPEGGDAVVMAGHDQAMSWLSKVARGTVSPAGIVDSSPDVVDSGSVVVSSPRRERFTF